MTDTPTTVVYLAGTGRSGSTLLASILGQLEGAVSVGEVRYIWERGAMQNRLCGCGAPFADCPFWSKVLETAFPNGYSAPELRATQNQLIRIRRLPHVVRARASRPRTQAGLDEPYSGALVRLYEAIAEVAGVSIVIDSSKLPSYAMVLEATRGLDVRVLHLLRDPRAAAFSWLRKKKLNDGAAAAFMEQQGVFKSSLLWDLWNILAEATWGRDATRYLRIRYEDLMDHSPATVSSIARWMGLTPTSLPFVAADSVALEPTHSVAGNPNRLDSGVVRLRPDAEWLHDMNPRDRAVVSLITMPLRWRYRYR